MNAEFIIKIIQIDQEKFILCYGNTDKKQSSKITATTKEYYT